MMMRSLWTSLSLLLLYEVQAKTRIVGGGDAEVDRFPYFTALYAEHVHLSQFKCGGTLVAPDVVLTAAHCTNDDVSIDFVVVNSTAISGVGGYTRQVVKTIKHPNWNPENLRNDIMLLVLDEEVEAITPVAYSRKFPVVSALDSLLIMGLGRLEEDGALPLNLQEAQVDLVDFATCDDAYSENGLLDFLTGLTDATQFCAAAPGRDACQGDSGGPLVLSSPSSASADIQVGLVSFGSGCAEEGFPGVYTKISVFSDWLDKTICVESQASSTSCSSSSSPPESITGRNIRIANGGMIVATRGEQGLETIIYQQQDSVYSLPSGLATFDDISIAGNFIFALSVEDRTICTYEIVDSTNDIVLSSCHQGSWNVGAFGGISCTNGVCVVAQGEAGMSILDYDTESGDITSSARIRNLMFDNAYALVDVELVDSQVAAMSTHFDNGFSVFRPKFGTTLVNLETFAILDDSFRVRQNVLRTNYAVGPSNFALVNAPYHNPANGERYLYTAHGGMTVSHIGETDSTKVIYDTALDGRFRALTVACHNGILAFGGIVSDDGRDYVMVFDGLESSPMQPKGLALFQIPFRVLSVAIRENIVAVVGASDDIEIIDLTEVLLAEESVSGSGGGVSGSGGDVSGSDGSASGSGGDVSGSGGDSESGGSRPTEGRPTGEDVFGETRSSAARLGCTRTASIEIILVLIQLCWLF